MTSPPLVPAVCDGAEPPLPLLAAGFVVVDIMPACAVPVPAVAADVLIPPVPPVVAVAGGDDDMPAVAVPCGAVSEGSPLGAVVAVSPPQPTNPQYA
ncbi:MAG TPA: hypothetical protein VJV78_28520 [Polyangiales bacterium]|nr:hypothetical protein [Polyangiales bacterium]